MAWSLAAPLGCKKRDRPQPPPTPPAAATEDTRQRSQLHPMADEVIDALLAGDAKRLHGKMTADLRARVRRSDLEAASARLTSHFGSPTGILEEKVHREGGLQWYTGLVVYARQENPAGKTEVERRGSITPVLMQFAMTSEGRLARLLVREHWFLDSLRPPLDFYIPANRFHLPARGEWTVSNGGPTRATNKHHGSRTQRYAYDMVVRKNGRAKAKGQKGNEAHFCHGEDLLATASGTVVHAMDGVPENQPGDRGKGGGNGVVIDHGFGEFSAVWHAVPGSITVEIGDEVEQGQVIGKVGNSGRSSGPHIHFHVAHGRHGFGLPTPFVDVDVDNVFQEAAVPLRGDRVVSTVNTYLATGPRLFIDA